MRVIAGEFRGVPLKAPKGDRTRPTTDRVKESLFAILTPVLGDADVLDLFAGSGALAIEALSRGARRAVLVDRSPDACACIKANLQATHQNGKTQLLAMPVQRALESLRKEQQAFDLVLLDPPYERGFLLPTLQQLTSCALVRPNGIVVAEHSRKEEIPRQVENLACIRQEVYGDTAISFWQNRPSDR